MTWFNVQRVITTMEIVDEFDCECDPSSQEHYDLIGPYVRDMPAGRYIEDGRTVMPEDDNPPA